jgi:hypothetical protein
MNTPIRPLVILAAISPLAALAQVSGPSLTPPPGAPAPQFKTLAQVEARTPLSPGQPGVAINAAGTITISQPGSYYLTANVTITTAGAHGISIAADSVTLDLNGFVLGCTSGNGGTAIVCDNRKGTRIRNGGIVGGTTVAGAVFTAAGWERGVSADSGSDTTVSEVAVRGVRTDGIFASTDATLVEDCSVNVCGGIGVRALSVRDTTVRAAGGTAGILTGTLKDAGQVVNCYSENLSATGWGIYSLDGTVVNSRGLAAGGGEGIYAENVVNSRGDSSGGTGVRAQTATGSSGSSTTGFGMQITGTASSCRGNRPGGTAISAAIAIGCTAVSGTITSAQKHLGTP